MMMKGSAFVLGLNERTNTITGIFLSLDAVNSVLLEAGVITKKLKNGTNVELEVEEVVGYFLPQAPAPAVDEVHVPMPSDSTPEIEQATDEIVDEPSDAEEDSVTNLHQQQKPDETDRRILVEVQEWAEARSNKSLSSTMVKDVTWFDEGGNVRFIYPDGQVKRVPGIDFSKYLSGTKPWPRQRPSEDELDEQIKKLESLSYIATRCEICEWAIGPFNFERTFILKLTDGNLVLPFTDRKGRRASFRQSHIDCRIIEEKYPTWFVGVVHLTDQAELASQIQALADIIMESARARGLTLNKKDTLVKLLRVHSIVTGKDLN